ncbi:hypothetical protein C8Q80DRAFT_1193030 [Daedaleopsis nitida]|nr:hypothetical protein C8Q80DRAFT_1193030 [Daedaleopsis nitida]
MLRQVTATLQLLWVMILLIQTMAPSGPSCSRQMRTKSYTGQASLFPCAPPTYKEADRVYAQQYNRLTSAIFFCVGEYVVSAQVHEDYGAAVEVKDNEVENRDGCSGRGESVASVVTWPCQQQWPGICRFA